MRYVDLDPNTDLAETSAHDAADDPQHGSAVNGAPAVFADNPTARELAIWLQAFQSFFNVAHQPLAEDERAEVLTRNWNKETSVARCALLRSSHLTFLLVQELDNTYHGAVDPNAVDRAIDFSAANSTQVLGAVSSVDRNKQSTKAANTAFVELMEILSDVRSICDAMLESRAVSFSAWASIGKVLARELKRSSAACRLARVMDVTNIHPSLLALTANLTPDPLGANVRQVFSGLASSLEMLSFIERDLRQDYPLKPALPLFTLINQETRGLLELLQTRVMRAERLTEEVFEALDSTSYAIRMELRKVFEHELAGLSQQRDAPVIRARVENAHGLLRDSFQQSTVVLAQVFDPTLDGPKLFSAFRTKVEQSLALRRDLWTVLQFVRHAEKESSERPVLDALLEPLAGFRDGSMHYLMYKDWETYERFVEDVASTRGAVELKPVLHRFATYLETLFSQISMRAVFTDHPFEPPKAES
ncbi:MAG: hypothetical protein H0T92_15735 [Pyrinomonadaceae bacterium]|nr:hypothetical protein [Pyrinomonadaceae bacterium]